MDFNLENIFFKLLQKKEKAAQKKDGDGHLNRPSIREATQMAKRHRKVLNTISKEENANYNNNTLYITHIYIRRANF